MELHKVLWDMENDGLASFYCIELQIIVKNTFL